MVVGEHTELFDPPAVQALLDALGADVCFDDGAVDEIWRLAETIGA